MLTRTYPTTMLKTVGRGLLAFIIVVGIGKCAGLTDIDTSKSSGPCQLPGIRASTALLSGDTCILRVNAIDTRSELGRKCYLKIYHHEGQQDEPDLCQVFIEKTRQEGYAKRVQKGLPPSPFLDRATTIDLSTKDILGNHKLRYKILVDDQSLDEGGILIALRQAATEARTRTEIIEGVEASFELEVAAYGAGLAMQHESGKLCQLSINRSRKEAALCHPRVSVWVDRNATASGMTPQERHDKYIAVVLPLHRSKTIRGRPQPSFRSDIFFDPKLGSSLKRLYQLSDSQIEVLNAEARFMGWDVEAFNARDGVPRRPSDRH